jgi:hypothetical protein
MQNDDYLEAVSGLKALQLQSAATKKTAQAETSDDGGEDEWETL